MTKRRCQIWWFVNWVNQAVMWPAGKKSFYFAKRWEILILPASKIANWHFCGSKVAKEDIQVRFFEENQGVIVWEGYADFQHNNVHKQVAISFRTPKYKTLDIEQSVKVSFCKQRKMKWNWIKFFTFSALYNWNGRPTMRLAMPYHLNIIHWIQVGVHW